MEAEQNLQKRSVHVGIDFGTQNLVVAVKSDDETTLPIVIINNLSNDHTP